MVPETGGSVNETAGIRLVSGAYVVQNKSDRTSAMNMRIYWAGVMG